MHGNRHGTRRLISSLAHLPEWLSIEIKGTQKRRFHTTGVRREMPRVGSTVVAAINEEVAPPVAVEITNPYIASERATLYPNKERIWNGDFAIQQGIFTRWSVLDARIGSPSWVCTNGMADDGEREAGHNGKSDAAYCHLLGLCSDAAFGATR
jgi:hypothetical protein